jgi:uncharacterized phage protein gp47/JayE
MAEETFFELPTVPDEIGVLLPPVASRRLDYSALDFQNLRRAVIEYVQTYYPDKFNNFVAADGAIMMTEIVAAIGSKLSLRSDILFRDAIFGTCATDKSLTGHLGLIGQRRQRQTPASTDIEVTVDNPVATRIEINPGLTFTVRGVDRQDVIYELYAAPGDFTSKIVIPAGKRGVIAFGLEGRFVSQVTSISQGGINQQIVVNDETMLETPLLVTVSSGTTSEQWTAVFEPLERYGPSDKVVEVIFVAGNVTFRFGDDVHGRAPISGQQITIRYRSGGGSRGRIGINQINEARQLQPLPPASSAVSVRFRNITPSQGGTDVESFVDAKRRAPRAFATHNSIVTAIDYAQLTASFSHAVYGSVFKAVSSLRTSRNANQVEVYILAQGNDGNAVAPSLGLKQALATYIDDLNVATDSVVVLDGSLYPVDLDMHVVMSRNADGTVVQSKIEQVVTDFFAQTDWSLGEPLYVSNLIERIEAVDGVSFLNLFSPSDDVLPASVDNPVGIAFNQLITLVGRKIQYFYEQGRLQGHQASQ